MVRCGRRDGSTPRVEALVRVCFPPLRSASPTGEVGLASRGELVADLEAQREAEVLQLADVDLEGLGLASEAGGEIGGAHGWMLGDRPEHRVSPRAVCAHAV